MSDFPDFREGFFAKVETHPLLYIFERELVIETLEQMASNISSSVQKSKCGKELQDVIAVVRQLVGNDSEAIKNIFLDLDEGIKYLCDELPIFKVFCVVRA